MDEEQVFTFQDLIDDINCCIREMTPLQMMETYQKIIGDNMVHVGNGLYQIDPE